MANNGLTFEELSVPWNLSLPKSSLVARVSGWRPASLEEKVPGGQAWEDSDLGAAAAGRRQAAVRLFPVKSPSVGRQYRNQFPGPCTKSGNNGTEWYRTVWHVTGLYGTVWYETVWYGMVRSS